MAAFIKVPINRMVIQIKLNKRPFCVYISWLMSHEILIIWLIIQFDCFQSDTEPNLEGYNVKQRKSSMGETIQNFIKDKLHKSPTVEEKGHRITEPATNKKSGERRTSIADFLKSPLDISKKRDRSQSLPQTGDFKEEKPEVATVDAAESSNSRSPTRLGMFSPKSKNKRTTPANVLCNG